MAAIKSAIEQIYSTMNVLSDISLSTFEKLFWSDLAYLQFLILADFSLEIFQGFFLNSWLIDFLCCNLAFVPASIIYVEKINRTNNKLKDAVTVKCTQPMQNNIYSYKAPKHLMRNGPTGHNKPVEQEFILHI